MGNDRKGKAQRQGGKEMGVYVAEMERRWKGGKKDEKRELFASSFN